MQPIRGEREDEYCHDPWNNVPQQTGQNDTTHVLNDAGAIESHRSATAAVGRRVPSPSICQRKAVSMTVSSTLSHAKRLTNSNYPPKPRWLATAALIFSRFPFPIERFRN